jgi:hypothetical protein
VNWKKTYPRPQAAIASLGVMEDEEKYKSGTVEERVAYPDGLSEEQSTY